MYRAVISGIVAVAVLLGGCGSAKQEQSGATGSRRPQLAVSAASSLHDVMPRVDERPAYQFAASNTLATQIAAGAQVDVFAAADLRLQQQLYDKGLVERPVPFAQTRVVLIVPRSSSIRSLGELAADDSQSIIIARPGVPLGDYTTTVLKALGRGDVGARARSLEPDARSVAEKVALGEADAGFVYATDARAVRTKVRVIQLPPTAVNRATYAVSIVRSSERKREARAFIDRLVSSSGQKELVRAGFDLPSG